MNDLHVMKDTKQMSAKDKKCRPKPKDHARN